MSQKRSRRPTADPKIAVGYGRISKDEDHNSVSLEAQRADFFAWCKRNGVEPAGWEADDDVCGATRLEDRDGLPRAIGLLREHKAGLLIIPKRDRLARDSVEAGLIEREVGKAGARIVCVDGTGAGDSPTDVFQVRVLDAVAELERGFIRARTKRALRQKADKGERVSREAPFGYSFVEVEGDKTRVTPNPAEQGVEREILQLRAEGTSYYGIAKHLTETGAVCRGKRWHPSTVRDICLRQKER